MTETPPASLTEIRALAIAIGRAKRHGTPEEEQAARHTHMIARLDAELAEKLPEGTVLERGQAVQLCERILCRATLSPTQAEHLHDLINRHISA